MIKLFRGFIALSLLSVALVACGSEVTNKTTQSYKAAEAAASITFVANAEIDNIKRRLELTSDPAIVGYVLLLNEMGQPIMYTSAVGKITSSGKRLTSPNVAVGLINEGSYGNTEYITPSDEGTWGSSSPYIFFWTAGGQYIQWNGKYLYSDQPFRTSVEPLIIRQEG